ncbi:MAG TPA: IS4 family transposase, partial [Candidatus Acidoferrales bacterium]|nr:IS4 family transposase [Candidatus Acidoferrales bacterium]HXQ23048.1 IS4 family transposase [Candidatus Acidoferrales bacterium]
ILQVFSLTLFEKTPIPSLFQRFDTQTQLLPFGNQLTLFDF